MDSNDSPRMLWKHSNPQSTAMYSFMEEVNKKQGLELKVCTVMDTSTRVMLSIIYRLSKSYITTLSKNALDSGNSAFTL